MRFIACVFIMLIFSVAWAQESFQENEPLQGSVDRVENYDRIAGSLLLLNTGLIFESGDLPYFLMGVGIDVKLSGILALEGSLNVVPASAEAVVGGGGASSSGSDKILSTEFELFMKYAITNHFWTSGGFTYRNLFDSYYTYKESLGMEPQDSPPREIWVIKASGGYNKVLSPNTMAIYSLSIGYQIGQPDPFMIGFHFTSSTRSKKVLEGVSNFFRWLRGTKEPSN